MENTNLKNMQAQVDTWVKQFPEGYWPPFQQMAQLTEEAGEVARALLHLHEGKKLKEDEAKANLTDELGDVLFVLACIANSHNISLDDAFTMNIQKRYGRK